jgi:hypothetical protein
VVRKWTKWTAVDLVDGSGRCIACLTAAALAQPLLTHAIHAFGKAAFFEKTLS